MCFSCTYLYSCVSAKRKRGKTRRRDGPSRRDGASKKKESWRREGTQKRETGRWTRNCRWSKSRGWSSVCFLLSVVPSSGRIVYELHCDILFALLSRRRKQAEQEEELRRKEKSKWVSREIDKSWLNFHSFCTHNDAQCVGFALCRNTHHLWRLVAFELGRTGLNSLTPHERSGLTSDGVTLNPELSSGTLRMTLWSVRTLIDVQRLTDRLLHQQRKNGGLI